MARTRTGSAGPGGRPPAARPAAKRTDGETSRRAPAGHARRPASSPPPSAPAGPRLLRFAEIAGQREAIWRVQSSLAGGRLHHALLFDGPAGCGKSTLAVALAAALSCRKRAEARPLPALEEILRTAEAPAWPAEACGDCASCRKMPEHPDLMRLSVEPGKTRISIEQVRDTSVQMAYPPHESPRRTVLVQDADRLSPEAANALLKTLEEPSAGNLVVLTTSRPAHLLPTIRSRCVRVPLRPLPPGTIRRLLAREFPDATDAALDLAAGLSAGGMTRARELMTGDPAAAMAPMAEFGRAVDAGDLAGLLAAVESLGPDRDRAAAELDLLLVLLRDRLVSASGGSTFLGTTAASAADAFARHPVEAVAVEGGLVSEARRNLEANANPQITLEWLATACARAVARARRGSSPDG